jgi:hypothetical protein
MNTFTKRITTLSKVSGLLGLMIVAGTGASKAQAPLVGGGNPPMPPSAAEAAIGGPHITPRWSFVFGIPGAPTIFDSPLVGGGNPPMPPSLMESPLVGGGNPPMPPSLMDSPLVGGGNPPMPPSLMDSPLVGGGNPPMPPSLMDSPLVGGGNPPMPPSLQESPLVGGGNPPMPPSVMESPLVGGGNPPMPPSAAVVANIGGVSIYADGTVGYPNGDFQFTSGAYLWADGFVRFDPAPADFVWTNYAGVIILTTLGDVASNGLPHVEFPTLVGL